MIRAYRAEATTTYRKTGRIQALYDAMVIMFSTIGSYFDTVDLVWLNTAVPNPAGFEVFNGMTGTYLIFHLTLVHNGTTVRFIVRGNYGTGDWLSWGYSVVGPHTNNSLTYGSDYIANYWSSSDELFAVACFLDDASDVFGVAFQIGGCGMTVYQLSTDDKYLVISNPRLASSFPNTGFVSGEPAALDIAGIGTNNPLSNGTYYWLKVICLNTGKMLEKVRRFPAFIPTAPHPYVPRHTINSVDYLGLTGFPLGDLYLEATFI